MSTGNRLRVLEETEEESPPKETSSPLDEARLQAVLTIISTATRVVSERVASLVLPCIVLILGFILWRQVLDNPNVYQLTGLGIFGAFSVAIVFLRRK